MIKIPDGKLSEFMIAHDKYKQCINTMDIYFQNIRLLNNRTKYINKNDYMVYLQDELSKIELVSNPLDVIIPSSDDSDHLFDVNPSVPEYESLKNIITEEYLTDLFKLAHPSVVALKNNEAVIETMVDEVFINYLIYKYIDMISIFRLNCFSVMTPVIEWVVTNITLNDIKNQLTCKRVKEDKILKYLPDNVFESDYNMNCKNFADICDIDTIMLNLISNINIKSDIIWIIGIYLAAGYSLFDVDKGIDSPCVKFVEDVVSKII